MPYNNITSQQKKRIDNLAQSSSFIVHIDIAPHILEQLSQAERLRMSNKLILVEHATQRLAAGMLKGTIKYSSDKLDLAQWWEHFSDELYDQVNYLELMREMMDDLVQLSKLNVEHITTTDKL